MSYEEISQSILIVDDEPVNIHALATLLKDEYLVRVANSGEKVLEILFESAQKQPDLILLDIQMPGIDGYEVCRRIKADPATNGIAIIFVTARDSASDEEYGLNLGAVDYIVKPFNPAIVRARVRTHMNLKYKSNLLEKYALLDGLTGIPNRRSFDELYEKELRRCMRDGLPLSIVMMDIDNFKHFNDNYGHGAGDQCLQKVAQALSSVASRPGDQICRYGGEEFVAILPDTDSSGALKVAEQLRAGVEGLSIRHEYSDASSVVTLSLGVATFEPGARVELEHESLLVCADDALYQAKRQGRNRVCCQPVS